MARKPRIRWRKSDDEELKRVVKNFNAKISRLEKKDPKNKNALPQRITQKEVKDMIITRQDFNREIKSLKRFTRRGKWKKRKDGTKYYDAPENLVSVPAYERDANTNEIIPVNVGNKYNMVMTKWQRTDMRRRAAVVNRRRKERAEEIIELPVTSRGKEQGYTIAQMGKLNQKEFLPINAFTPSMTRQDIHEKHKTLMRESTTNYWEEREVTLKGNYIKALYENFNPNDIAGVVDAIGQMPYEDFYKIFQKEEQGKFTFIYSPDLEAYKQNVELLKIEWLPEGEGE